MRPTGWDRLRVSERTLAIMGKNCLGRKITQTKLNLPVGHSKIKIKKVFDLECTKFIYRPHDAS